MVIFDDHGLVRFGKDLCESGASSDLVSPVRIAEYVLVR